MNNVQEKISVNDKVIFEFQSLKNSLKGFYSLREKAIAEFERMGIPSRKNEEYKYSNAQALFQGELKTIDSRLRTQDSIEQFLIPELNANTVVLINGIFSEELSSEKNLPKNVIVSSFAKAIENNFTAVENHFSKYADISTDAFIAMNTAFASDGVFISVPDNTIVETPIHIINILTNEQATTSNTLIQPRFLFLIGKNSEVKIIDSIETMSLNTKIICNSVAEILVGENSKTHYYRIQSPTTLSSLGKDGLRLITTTQVKQERNSHFDTNTVTLNSNWVRNNLNISLDGEYCETHLNGLFITKGSEHVDNHTLVDNRKPNCQSSQLYKGILDDKSMGVFNGKIFVQPDAQKTNAYQSSKNILLSDDASINTKPQLEIYADDVKCSHGSTTGQLNEEAMFYLRARGLSEDSARAMLTFAFASDVVDTIRIEAVKSFVDDLVQKKLNG